MIEKDSKRYMSNQNLEIGSNFMEKSLYESASLWQNGAGQHEKEPHPLPFKIYRQARLYQLAQTPPLTLGEARCSFHEFYQTDLCARPAPRRDMLDLDNLSALLYYTYGFSRHDAGAGVVWPFHRFVPSARCFFPAELYMWLPRTAHIPAGIYHYDNLHHALALLRQGEYLDVLAQATDTELDNCLGVLFISALFWKNAFHYFDFSYRLSTQEAGLVTSNALLITSALGFCGRIHYQFLDRPLNRLLGFEPGEESLLAIVPLYPRLEQKALRRRCLGNTTAAQWLWNRIEPVTLDYFKTGSFEIERCPLLTEIDQHSFLEESCEIVTAPTTRDSGCLRTEECIALPAPFGGQIELAQALAVRSSGDMEFLPRRALLPWGAFWETIRYSLSVYNSDLQHLPSPPRLQLYIVVQRVEGMEQGIYRFCTHCGMLHIVELGDLSLPIQRMQTQGNIRSLTANLVCYLVGDYPATSRLFGNRAYRILHLEAGLVAQRICVMSASQGLVTRYSNSYNAVQAKTLLKLTGTSLTPLAELVIGYEPQGVQAGRRYRFSLFR